VYQRYESLAGWCSLILVVACSFSGKAAPSLSLPYSGGEVFRCTQGNDVKDGTHNGVLSKAWDFSNGASGSSIVAPARGHVVFAALDGTPTEGWGYTVVIEYFDGTFGRVAHLQKDTIVVEKGAFVNKGQILGKVGSSGKSTAAHIHYQTQTGATNALSTPSSFVDPDVLVKNSDGIPSPCTGELSNDPDNPANHYISYNYPFIPISGHLGGGSIDQTGTYEVNTSVFSLDGESFGLPGDYPIIGDWDGDGVEDIGVFRPINTDTLLSTFFLGRVATRTIPFGTPHDIPIAGDWNEDGSDTIGVYRPSTSTFFLDFDSNGAADESISFGIENDTPIIGDWDGDGVEDIGVFRPRSPNPNTNTFFLSLQRSGKNETLSFELGNNGDYPIIGDWDGDADDNIGVFRPNTKEFFKFANKPDNQSLLKIAITNASINPRNSQPGETIQLTYGIAHDAPQCTAAVPGAQIRRANSSSLWANLIPVGNHSAVGLCGSTNVVANRSFKISTNTGNGQYDVRWLLMTATTPATELAQKIQPGILEIGELGDDLFCPLRSSLLIESATCPAIDTTFTIRNPTTNSKFNVQQKGTNFTVKNFGNNNCSQTTLVLRDHPGNPPVHQEEPVEVAGTAQNNNDCLYALSAHVDINVFNEIAFKVPQAAWFLLENASACFQFLDRLASNQPDRSWIQINWDCTITPPTGNSATSTFLSGPDLTVNMGSSGVLNIVGPAACDDLKMKYRPLGMVEESDVVRNGCQYTLPASVLSKEVHVRLVDRWWTSTTGCPSILGEVAWLALNTSCFPGVTPPPQINSPFTLALPLATDPNVIAKRVNGQWQGGNKVTLFNLDANECQGTKLNIAGLSPVPGQRVGNACEFTAGLDSNHSVIAFSPPEPTKFWYFFEIIGQCTKRHNDDQGWLVLLFDCNPTSFPATRALNGNPQLIELAKPDDRIDTADVLNGVEKWLQGEWVFGKPITTDTILEAVSRWLDGTPVSEESTSANLSAGATNSNGPSLQDLLVHLGNWRV